MRGHARGSVLCGERNWPWTARRHTSKRQPWNLSGPVASGNRFSSVARCQMGQAREGVRYQARARPQGARLPAGTHRHAIAPGRMRASWDRRRTPPPCLTAKGRPEFRLGRAERPRSRGLSKAEAAGLDLGPAVCLRDVARLVVSSPWRQDVGQARVRGHAWVRCGACSMPHSGWPPPWPRERKCGWVGVIAWQEPRNAL